jgi:uncharacterized membrane protein
MENLVIATFRTNDDASKALNQLKELNQLEDIIIDNIVLIEKKEKQLDVLYHEGPETQDMPGESAFVGSLVGAIGGPVGMAIGMLTGVMIGTVEEDDTETFIDDLMEKVKKRLQPGDYAIVMDVEEYDDLFVDSYLESHHGKVARTTIGHEYDKYNEKQLKQLNKQIDDEEENLRTAMDESKLAIKERIRELKAERDERSKEFKARSANFKKLVQDRIVSMNASIVAAKGKRKERLKAQKEKLEHRLKEMNDKVASVLT